MRDDQHRCGDRGEVEGESIFRQLLELWQGRAGNQAVKTHRREIACNSQSWGHERVYPSSLPNREGRPDAGADPSPNPATRRELVPILADQDVREEGV